MPSERMTCNMRRSLEVSRPYWQVFLTAFSHTPSSVRSLILIPVVLLGSVYATQALTENLLYSFAGNPDGAGPYASLVRHSGILYGTTVSGGTFGDGTVFEVTTKGKEKVLHSFSGGADGTLPYGSLVFDKLGNLYGTTAGGGTLDNGTVFEISSSGVKTTRYAFAGGTDGSRPYAGLVFDQQGNLYGTTGSGGTFGNGTVFRLSPSGTETVLYSFTGGADGGAPLAGLILDDKGNLYGTTSGGGLSGCAGYSGCGVVFKVTTSGGSEQVLHSFAQNMVDGFSPSFGRLVRDTAGNLYGTTWQGGVNDRGTVFKLAKSGVESVLFSFDHGNEGYNPIGSLILDKYGNLYGTTFYTGNVGACGSVFEVSPSTGFQLLYDFTINRTDGCNPFAGLAFGTTGTLFGITYGGGTFGKGAVFELIP
jgi:uncharacterized repeat protein (TIGR03803 family)